MEKTAARDQRLGRAFNMKDPRARGHPLFGAVGDTAASPGGVLMLKRAIDHVGDGLEAAMRVPRGPLRLTRTVLHLAHLVHVNEGVEVALIEPVKGAPNREALTFDAPGGRRDGKHGTLDGGGTVGVCDSGQRQDVMDGYRGHSPV